MTFVVTPEPLDPLAVVRAVSDPRYGGIDVFLGAVRNDSQGRPVTLLEYEAYASMAARQMERIAAKIQDELGDVRLAAAHRIGRLGVGELAVVCAAGAPHRDEAFRACRLLIDRIKLEVPIWKREYGPDGPYWVGWEDARCSPHEHGHEHGPGKHGPDEHGHAHEPHGSPGVSQSAKRADSL